MSNGHVFVVQGRMENLDSDAVIVTTDLSFSVGGHWAPTLGLPDVGFDEAVNALQPDGWRARRWGRATAAGTAEPPKPTWFMDVAYYFSRSLTEDLDGVMARLRRVLAEVKELRAGQGRSHVLVSMPLLGTGYGGFGPIRGQVIDTQLRVCREESAALGIDIVIVANSTSDYTALQERRRELGSEDVTLTPALRAAAQQLAAVARSGDLALFLGAGVSIGAGLPSWSSLLGNLAEGKDVDLTQLSSTLDRAELLRIKYGADFGSAIAAQVTSQRRYAMTHAILAALGCRQVVTTNYDRLYELAAGDLQANVGVAVLPFDRAQQDRPWVLKMHGDAERPETIVLTRSDFVSYDATSRPMGSLVQSLMVTRHLLVVGASMTDDNFLRLTHEVLAFREAGSMSPEDKERPLGTVLPLQPEPAQAELWSGRFDYVPVSAADDPEESRARSLTIFLDHIALLAAGNSHLLDERYEALLEDREADLVARARELHDSLTSMTDRPRRWDPVVDLLGSLGASPRPSGGTSDR
jgi:hypothetical protein